MNCTWEMLIKPTGDLAQQRVALRVMAATVRSTRTSNMIGELYISTYYLCGTLASAMMKTCSFNQAQGFVPMSLVCSSAYLLFTRKRSVGPIGRVFKMGLMLLVDKKKYADHLAQTLSTILSKDFRIDSGHKDRRLFRSITQKSQTSSSGIHYLQTEALSAVRIALSQGNYASFCTV